MAENENEKIIYDIEVRTQQAQKALDELKQNFIRNKELLGKMNFEAEFKITGLEDFKTLRQRLTEVRKAIQYITAYQNRLVDISMKNKNGGINKLDDTPFKATLEQLRALEKALEDTQKKINTGNFNKQIQEQQKLQKALEKTITTYQRMEAAFSRSLTNKAAWSPDKFATQLAKFDDVVKQANNLSKQLGLEQTFTNPMRAIPDYNEYKKQTQQYLNEENKRRQKDLEAERKHQEELSNIKAKQNRQANDTQFTDEQSQRNKTFSNLKQDIIDRNNASIAEKKQLEKINTAMQQYMNIYDQLNTKKKLGVQLSEQEYATAQRQLKNAKERYKRAGGDANVLPTLGARKTFNNEAINNYLGGMNDKLMEAITLSNSYTQKMSRLRQVLEMASFEWERSGRTNQEASRVMKQSRLEIEKTAKSLEKLHQQMQKTETVTDKIARGIRTHGTWIASSMFASIPLQLPQAMFTNMKELESQFATVMQVMPEIEHAKVNANMAKGAGDMETYEKEIAKVNNQMQEFIKIGEQFGVSVNEVIESGASIGRMYGQGENGRANVNLLTQQAARIAVADNFPMMQATKGLESALSQFGLQTDDTNQLMINSNRIIDVWTTAAHRGAASAKDLTEGVMLAGAAAHQAGISFEFLNALIETGVRATGRSGNEIGNSIKSFVNSMQSDKSIKALQDFGVNVYKDNGDGTQSLRSMEDIILDVSQMMATTDKDYSGLLLTLSGGKYQVSKLTAILKDYKELIRMTGILNSENVTGFTDEQIKLQLDTLNRQVEALHANIQGLFMNIGENGGLDALKFITEKLNNILTGIRQIDASTVKWTSALVTALVALKGANWAAEKFGRAVERGTYAWKNYEAPTTISPSNSQQKSDKPPRTGVLGRIFDIVREPYKKGREDVRAENGYGAETNKNTQQTDENTTSERANALARQDNTTKIVLETEAIAANTTAKTGNTTANNTAVTAKTGNKIATTESTVALEAQNIALNANTTATNMNAGAKSRHAIAETANKAAIDATTASLAKQKIASNMIDKNSGKIVSTGTKVATTLGTIGTVANTAGKGLSIASIAGRGLSAVLAAFTGPIGTAIALGTTAISIISMVAESLGDEINKAQQAKDAYEELNATQEQEYNTKIRATQSAEDLANKYNELTDYIKQNTLETEKSKEINDIMSAQKEAIISLIGEENIAYDENGKIKITNIQEVAKEATAAHEEDIKQRKEKILSQQQEVKNQIKSTEEILKTFDAQVSGLDALGRAWDSLKWSISATVHRAKAGFYYMASAQMKSMQFGKSNSATDELEAMAKQETAEAEREAALGILGSREDIAKNLENLKNQDKEFDRQIADLNLQTVNLKENPTGGADQDRGNLIAEPPEEKKKKSKADKKAKQQEAYNKVGNRVALIADENIIKYGMKRTSFNGGLGEFSSGNTEIDNAISKAAQKYGLNESWLHALVQKESSYNVRAGEGTNYKGLTQISDDKLNAGQNIWDIYDNIDAGARYFKQMLEMAGGDYRDAYVKYNAGPYAGYTQEAENNADAFVGLHDKITNGTSDFGVTNSFRFTGLGSDVESASQWANEMVALGKYYGDTGCTAFAKAFLEQSGNSFANEMSMWTPTLMEQAKKQGLFKDQRSGFNAGDIVIADTDGSMDEPDHVVIADGKGGYWGNSTSNKQVVHGDLSDFANIWGGIATGSGSYSPSMSSTSLQTSMRLVYDHLKSIGLDLEQLNMLADVKDIPSMIAKTDAMGMNLSYGQKTPEAGDILYTKDGKAYIVNSQGGYGGINGEKGSNWKDLDLTDTFTSWRESLDLTLENAGSKLGKLKLSEKAEELINKRIDLDTNELQKAFERYSEENKQYGFEKQNIENMRSLYGQYNAEAYLKEYQNEIENYNLQKITSGILVKSRDNLETQINDYFSGGVLREVLNNNGLNSWKQLSQENLNDIASSYPDNYLKTLIDNWKNVKNNADEANIKMQEALQTVKQLNGERTPEEELKWGLENIERNTNFWVSDYANSHNNSYDGLDWQTDKRTHEDANKQVRLYSNYIAQLNKELIKLQKDNAPKAFIEETTNAIIEARTKMNDAEKLAKETSYELSRSSRETISGMLHDLIKGGSSFKEIWTNIWDDIAKIALDRIMGINDTTNGSWNLISNIFGLGKVKRDTPATVGEGEKYVDDYNVENNTLGSALAKPANTVETERYKKSTEGIVDFYSKDSNSSTTSISEAAKATETTSETSAVNTQMQASQNMLQASQQMLQATNTETAAANQNASTASMNASNIAQETMNTTQDTISSTQETIASNQNTVSANQNSAAANTNQGASTNMQNAAMQMQSAANNMQVSSTTPSGGGNSKGGTNVGSYLGFIPTILSWFSKGGSLTSKDKFATGSKKGKMITDGGIVKGAGTGTSDSILAYLHDQGRFIGISNGEYIMNARATSKYGPLLEQMNLDKFADGGYLAGETYVPTLRNPNIANKIAKQDANKRNQNATMEKLLGQQNGILQGIASGNGENNGNNGQVVVLNTRASKEEIFSALASDPKALQKLLGNNRRNGFR